MNKAVIYTRVSTNDQCVSNQLKVLREIAEKKGLEVVREISDEGVSGAKGRDEREGFNQLIKGSVQKEWDIKVVPTIIIFEYGVEVKRFEADLSMKFREDEILNNIRREIGQ